MRDLDDAELLTVIGGSEAAVKLPGHRLAKQRQERQLEMVMAQVEQEVRLAGRKPPGNPIAQQMMASVMERFQQRKEGQERA